MAGSDTCKECGVPSLIGNLFSGIQELIGIPIEHIVIESKRRETRGYVEKVFLLTDRDAMWSIDGGMDEFLPGSG